MASHIDAASFPPWATPPLRGRKDLWTRDDQAFLAKLETRYEAWRSDRVERRLQVAVLV